PSSRPSSLLLYTDSPPPPIYTLSLHDALPIYAGGQAVGADLDALAADVGDQADELAAGVDVLLHDLFVGVVELADSATAPDIDRSEEHTSELQSLRHLVCRLLLEKKKKKIKIY